MEHYLSEIQVSYKTSNIEKVKIVSGQDAAQVLLRLWNSDTLELQEEFKLLLLNRANEVLGIYSLSKGGVSGTVVDIKLLLAVVLKCNASSFIMAHNHPSGNLNPSEADKQITSKVKRAADLLEVKLLDHIIIAKHGFYSFAEHALIN